MAISFSYDAFYYREGEDRDLQCQGHRLGNTLKTEQDAEAALIDAIRSKNRSGWYMVAAAIVFLATVGLGCFGLLRAVADAALWVVIGCIFVLGLGPAARSELDKMVRLCSPLSSEPKLCSKLRALASQSPAVTTYVQNITASGRQLRVFDVACANAVHGQEQARLSAQFGADACASLHSL